MITRRGFLRLFTILPATLALRESRAGRFDEVLLLDCPVAGYRFHSGPPLECQLAVDQRLALARERDNPHDRRAVAIRLVTGERIGYVPFHLNAIPARLLDGGVNLTARISSLREAPAPPWKRLRVGIFVIASGGAV